MNRIASWGAMLPVCAYLFVAGCAASPDSISAAYVSPLTYKSYSCDQLAGEMGRVNRKVQEVAGVQSDTATKDAVAMGVGLVLFWPALFLLAIGSDKEEELARLKGEFEAVERAAIDKECSDVVREIERVREEAEQQQKEARAAKSDFPQ